VKYICNVSGGLCSFWAWHRTVEKHGPLKTVPLFADTLIESKELYAFNEQCAKLLGTSIIRVSKEMTPWQLFRHEKMIGNNRLPICSTKLKREILNEWMVSNFELDSRQENFLLEPATVVLGFDWTESHRVVEMQKAHLTWRIEAPMAQAPVAPTDPGVDAVPGAVASAAAPNRTQNLFGQLALLQAQQPQQTPQVAPVRGPSAEQANALASFLASLKSRPV